MFWRLSPLRLRKTSFETKLYICEALFRAVKQGAESALHKEIIFLLGTGEVGPWRIKRCEEKPTVVPNAVFILQPRLKDIDNKLTSQMDKKSGCWKGCGENESVKGRSYTRLLKRMSPCYIL